MRISKTARYSKDFNPLDRFSPDELTLRLWHFDEGSGQVAYDSSPFSSHATLGSKPEADSNDPTWTSGYP